MSLEADLGTASDPTTSPEELRRLASSSSMAVRQAVAQNMNADTETLKLLFVLFPSEILDNPASAILDMEYEKSGPLGWIDAGILMESAKAAHTPPEVLARIGAVWSPHARLLVAANEATPPDMLVSLSMDGYDDVRLAVAHNRKAPQQALSLLSGSRLDLVREAVAKHGSTSEDVLLRLANDPDEKVRRAVAQRTTVVPRHILQWLARDEETDPQTRRSARGRLGKAWR